LTWPAPSVPVFPAGAGLTETNFDSLWYDTAGFLQNRVVFRASQSSAATTLPDTGVATVIAFDTVLEDPYSGWNASTHAWEPPAGYSAWYDVTLTIRTATLASLVNLRPVLGGTHSFTLSCVQGSSNHGAGICATWSVYLVGGADNVSGACELINSGSNVNTSVTSGQQSAIEVVWVTQT
jgi:hypothetical protein